MNTRTRLALTAGVALSVAASLLVATGSPAAAAAIPPWEPDPGSIGSLTFYDSTGAVVTGGSINDAPFATYVKGSVAGRAGDTKATLFGYLPKNGVDIGAWSGEALTASPTYPNAAAPGALGSTGLPVVTLTSGDFTLATLVADLPNTAVDAYQGLYQLRVKTSGPGQAAGAEYQSSDILISGSTWTQVYGAPSEAPAVTTIPAVTGTARTGSKLTCNPGVWTGSPAPSFTYSWLRSGVAVSSASTRTVSSLDVGKYLQCKVTASNPAGSASSTSKGVKVTAGAAPVATVKPKIGGILKVGKKLTASHGTWSPAPTSYTYSWFVGGKFVKAGATANTFVLRSADKGKTVKVVIKALKTGYLTGQASVTTGKVT